jgi:hypothetical protein
VSYAMPPSTLWPSSNETVEYWVDPQTAADYLRTSRKHVLEMVRKGLIPGHPLDANSQKKDWRFLLSELRDHMLKSSQRPPEAQRRRL